MIYLTQTKQKNMYCSSEQSWASTEQKYWPMKILKISNNFQKQLYFKYLKYKVPIRVPRTDLMFKKAYYVRKVLTFFIVSAINNFF